MTASGPWRERTVLVTGATGFIGSHLVEALLRRGASVVSLVCDHDPRAALADSARGPRGHVVFGRLERFGDVKRAVIGREVDTVFHLGAQTLVGVARRDPLGTFETNVRGTMHVLEACRLAGGAVERVIVASSDKAYGECAERAYTEATARAGRYPYDVSKSCTDLLAGSYAATYAMPVAITRCGNVFGPGDLNWSRLVPGTIRALLRGERPVIRSDGSPLRDYVAVDDAVDGYLRLAGWLDDAGAAEADERAFNFGAEHPLSVLEMTRHLRRAVGREDLAPVIENTARAEIAAQHLDSSRARRELGWTPTGDVGPALADAVAWYRRALEEGGGIQPAPAHVHVVPARAGAPS